MIVEVKSLLIPYRVIKKQKLYYITSLNSKYYIRDYRIFLNELNQLSLLYINNPHPNADNGLFCLPKNIIELKWTDENRNIVENMLKTFNLDDCFFIPYSDELEYEEF